MQKEKPAVAHFVTPFLFQTGSWIYAQLTNLRTYRPFVLTSALENEQQFPFEAVYCYRQPFAGQGLRRIAARKAHEAITHARKRFYIDIIRTQKANLLHAHFGNEGYYNLNVAKSVQLPLVTTFYGYDMSMLPRSHPHWRKRYQRLFAEGAAFLAEGSFMAQSLVDLGCPSQKVRVQHLGVDIERFPFRERVKDTNEPVRMLMAASIREKKGIPFAIQAFAAAARKIPNMQLRIVGGAASGSEHSRLAQCKTLAANEGVSDKVHFLGYLPYSEYLQEIESAHIFLAPSITASDGDTEGGAPVGLIEACAHGIPAIASRHCDIPEVVQDGKSGILVGERDVEGLAKAMIKLATSPDQWARMGEFGRKHIEAEYDSRKQVARLEDIYNAVIG